jgi:hypothetical protein
MHLEKIKKKRRKIQIKNKSFSKIKYFNFLFLCKGKCKKKEKLLDCIPAFISTVYFQIQEERCGRACTKLAKVLQNFAVLHRCCVD